MGGLLISESEKSGLQFVLITFFKNTNLRKRRTSLRFGVFWELTILNVPEKSPNTIMQLSRSDSEPKHADVYGQMEFVYGHTRQPEQKNDKNSSISS